MLKIMPKTFNQVPKISSIQNIDPTLEFVLNKPNSPEGVLTLELNKFYDKLNEDSRESYLLERGYFSGAYLALGIQHFKIATGTFTLTNWEAEITGNGTGPVILNLLINGVWVGQYGTLSVDFIAPYAPVRAYKMSQLAYDTGTGADPLVVSAGDIISIEVISDGNVSPSSGGPGSAAVGPLTVGIYFQETIII